MKNRYNSVSNNYLQIQKEKVEKKKLYNFILNFLLNIYKYILLIQ